MSSENYPSSDPRQRYENFVDRYQREPQDISEQEAAARYQEVAPHLSPDEHLRAAQEAFARMSPEERVRFGRYMAEQAQQQGHDFIDLNQDGKGRPSARPRLPGADEHPGASAATGLAGPAVRRRGRTRGWRTRGQRRGRRHVEQPAREGSSGRHRSVRSLALAGRRSSRQTSS